MPFRIPPSTLRSLTLPLRPATRQQQHISHALPSSLNRSFSTKAPLQKIKNPNNPPLPPILDTDITENYLKGSGPGGQKINKTSSAVQILHHPTGIVVKCQSTRSRSQNRVIARRLLAEKIEMLEKGEESRVEKRRERERRRKGSREKKAKRKYRRLDEEKRGREEGEEGEGGEDGEGEVGGMDMEAEKDFRQEDNTVKELTPEDEVVSSTIKNDKNNQPAH